MANQKFQTPFGRFNDSESLSITLKKKHYLPSTTAYYDFTALLPKKKNQIKIIIMNEKALK